MLLKCQSVLAAGYFVRCILIIFVKFGFWLDFTRDYPNYGGDILWVFLIIQFFFYAIFPYMTLIISHWYNAKTGETVHHTNVSANQSEISNDSFVDDRLSITEAGLDICHGQSFIVKYVRESTKTVLSDFQ